MLVLSQYVEPDYAQALLADNAEGVGYLLKDRVADVERFIDAVERVAAGGSALDPEVVSHLVGRSGTDGPLERLTPREREVLELMAEGRSNAAIAEEFVVSERAVEKHVTSIFGKLELAARASGPPPRAGGARLPARLAATPRACGLPAPADARSAGLDRTSARRWTAIRDPVEVPMRTHNPLRT